MFRYLIISAFVASAMLVPAGVARAATQYTVNYRAAGNGPWVTYTTTPNAAQAEQTAANLQNDGYQSQVVTATTPFTTNYSVNTSPIIVGGTGAHGWYNSSYYVNHPYAWNGGWHNGAHSGIT